MIYLKSFGSTESGTYRTYHVTESSAPEESPDQDTSDGDDSGYNSDNRTDPQALPRGFSYRRVYGGGEIPKHIPRLYDESDNKYSEEQRENIKNENPVWY